jgi:hypothetical protein
MRISSKRIWVLAGAVIAVAALSRIVLTTRISLAGPNTVTAGTCSAEGYTITSDKTFGKASGNREITIKLDAKAPGTFMAVTFYADSGCTEPITTAATTANGQSEPFYIMTNAPGDFTIVATTQSSPTASLAVSSLPVPPVTTSPVGTPTKSGMKIGVLVGGDDGAFTNAEKISVAKSLGVSYIRTQVSTKDTQVPLSAIDADVAAGLKIVPSLRNKGATSKYSDPVTDIASYKANVSKFLSYYKPEVVAVENEEDNKAFIPNTSVAQYIAQVQATIDVAHPLGVKVTNGGISFPNAALATWNYYWTSGQYAKADSYRERLMVLASTNSGFKQALADVPTQADPNKPILARTATAKASLERTSQLIAAYKTLNIDYVNFHWYSVANGTLQETAQYLSQATGKPAMNNEIGQWDNSSDTVEALLKEASAARLAYILWYSGDGSNAIGLQNKDGSLRPTGETFKSSVLGGSL